MVSRVEEMGGFIVSSCRMPVTGNRGEFGVQSVNCEAMAQEAEEKKQMEDSESSPQMSEMTNAESDVTSGEEESTTGATEGTSNLRRRSSRFKSVDSRNLLDEIPVDKKQEDNNSSSAARVEVASNTKFTLRPSSPAHRKIKESPLSSDAIFHQASWKNSCVLISTGFEIPSTFNALHSMCEDVLILF